MACQTVTQTITTGTAALLSTSIIYAVSSIYVTKNLTQIVVETATVTTIQCDPTTVPAPTTTASSPPAPSPTLVGSPATCKFGLALEWRWCC